MGRLIESLSKQKNGDEEVRDKTVLSTDVAVDKMSYLRRENLINEEEETDERKVSERKNEF